MEMENLTIAHGENVTHHIAGLLITESCFFSVMPLSDDRWLFEVRKGEADSIRERIGI